MEEEDRVLEVRATKIETTPMTKEDFQIDIEQVESHFEDELEGIEIEVAERDIGNGDQFAIRAYDDTDLLWESSWFTQDEFENFCSGMKTLSRLFHEAEKTRERNNKEGDNQDE